jgi:hypothetical protein
MLVDRNAPATLECGQDASADGGRVRHYLRPATPILFATNHQISAWWW